jgi:hypothetical protein
MNKQTNLARMQTDGFKITQVRENIQNENSYNRWLKSLENQLEQEQKLRDKKRATFIKGSFQNDPQGSFQFNEPV